MTFDTSFEGPEKKLLVSFTPSTPGLRSMTCADLEQILSAASCSVISVARNEHMDAYLLSESSLFIADSYIMLKTCGTTTLLLALPVILAIAARNHQYPATVQYSRTEFSFPDQQPFPHDSFKSEVGFLDRVLRREGRSFEVGSVKSRAEWFVYVAELIPSAQPAVAQSLEIFMFDLDPDAMRHFQQQKPLEREGTNAVMSDTAEQSGLQRVLDDDCIVDAFDFVPCGYSLNAVLDQAFYTVHVSPEPESSYVSFESSVNIPDLASVIASVVKIFRPGRFTVGFLGSSESRALACHPEAPVDFSTLSKMLSSDFVAASHPSLFPVGLSMWANVGTYSFRDNIRHGKVEEMSESALDKLVTRYQDIRLMPSEDVGLRARSAFAGIRDIKHPTLVVDLSELNRRALLLKKALDPRFSARYAVRCNPDPVVLSFVDLLGWSFEAVSAAEVGVLRAAGVNRSKIIFASPVVTPDVIARLEDIGILSLFNVPESKLRRAMIEADVDVEVRVSVGLAEEGVSVCESVLEFSNDIRALALDCNPSLYLLPSDKVESVLVQGMHTIQEVLNKLPPSGVENTIVSIGEMFPGCRNTDLDMIHRLKRIECWNMFPKVCLNPGRWVVGPSASLAVRVIGRRLRTGGEEAEIPCYYLNDGIYGSFSSLILEQTTLGHKDNLIGAPHVIYRSSSGKKRKGAEQSEGSSLASSDDESGVIDGRDKRVRSILFGPTCDALDRIWVGPLPELNIDDILLFRVMGANSFSASSSFNGFGQQKDTIYVVGPDGAGAMLS